MYELKTKKNEASVNEFLDSVEDSVKREDSKKLLQIFKDVTGENPTMWGSAIIGFGKYSYKSKSGIEGDWFKVGFSPRKQSTTLYLTYGFENHKEDLEKLGKHKLGKACLYVNKLEDVDLDVLKGIIKRSWEEKR